MKIQRMPEDIVPLLNDLVRRLTALETRPLGTVFINESLIIKDPNTGVETIIGDLNEEGEDRHGIKQWVGDTTPPPIPTSPMVSANLGVFSVAWDGANKDGSPQAPDFSHLNVYGNDGVSTKLVGAVKTKDEVAIVTGAEYNVPWTFWFTSVDFNGNESAKSDDSLPISVTPLVEELDMKEILDDINDRFGGVITEAERLNDVLADAEQTITKTKTSLDNLENVRLPQVEANIEAAHQEILTTGAELDLRLDQAETDLNAAELGLNNLKNTELPAVKAQIEGVHQELVATGGQLDSRLDQAEIDLSNAEAELQTLETVTLPALNQRLADAEADITASGAELGSRLTQAETDLTAHNTRITQNKTDLTKLNNTTLPALNTDLTNAKTRLTAAEGEIATTKGKLSTAEGTLNTLKNTTIPALNTEVAGAKTRLTATETEVTNAKTRLGKAETDLTSAFGQIDTVDGKTQANALAASNAQAMADSANSAAASAAGIANGKGKVLVRSTAPVAADRNTVTLWIDTTGGANTPKRWTTGTTWVAVTDKAATDAAQAAATAQSKADLAHTNAGTAQTTANNAMTMAGSKSKVFYSTSDPSGTASLGDTWRKVNASNDVIAEWRWTAGNTWLTQQISSEAISNLDVGKLTAGSAIINTAVVNKIAIQTADVIKLNASAITAGTISADRLNVNDLAAKIATVIKLNADAITAGTIDTGRLNATEIAAAVATVIQLNASRITAGTISTDRLNATEIAARVATVIQLNAGAITAGTISTDRLDVNDIAAKTASFQKVDVKNLFATTGTFSEAVIEKLWADVIRARKITTDQLLVGSGSNLIVDPYFEDETTKAFRATLSNMSGGYGRNATTNLNWFGGTQTAGTVQTYYFSTINSRTKTDSMIPIVEGSKYRFKFLYNSVGGGARPVASAVRKDGQTAVTASGFKINGVSTSSFGSAGSDQIMEAVWEPKDSWNYAYFIPGIQWESTVTSAHIYGGASVQNMADGNLIVSGSIDADKINTNSVVAEVAKFIELDVSKLTATNATMGTAVIEKLWTDVVRSRKITTDQLLVGQGENLIPWDMVSTLEDSRSNITGYSSGSVQPTKQAGGGVAGGDHLYMVADWVNPGSNTLTWQLGNGTAKGITGRWPVEPEEELVFSAYVKAGGTYSGTIPGMRVAIYWYSGAGTNISNVSSTVTPLTWSWQKLTIDGKAPATAAYCLVYIRQDQPGGVRVDLPSLYRKKGASLIVDGSIAAKQIDSESVSAEVAKFINLDVSKLVATNATINTAVVNKLWTDVIRSRKITTDMMVVGSGGNHFPDPQLTDPDGWAQPTYIKNAVGRNGGKGIVVPASTGQIGTYYGLSDKLRQHNVIAGQEYRVSVWVKSTVAIPLSGVAIFNRYSNDAVSTGAVETIYNSGTPGTIETTPRLGVIPANTWRLLEGLVKMPTGAEQAYLGLYVSSGFNAAVTFSEPSVQTASGTGLIVDGAIEAKHITASESMSAKLGEFLTLNVENFNVTGTGKMSEAVITKLWTDVVQSKKITSSMIAIGDFSNYAIINPATDTNVEEPAGWATVTEGNYTKNVSGNYLMFKNRDKNVPFFSGDKVRIVFDAKTTTGTVTTSPVVWMYSKTGASTGAFSGDSVSIGTTEKTFETIITIDTVQATAAKWVTGIQSSSIGNVRIRNVRVQRMEAGELIVDGAVTALKIKSNAVESKHILANAVKADKIEAGAIRATHLAIGTGREIATNGSGQTRDNTGYEGFIWGASTASSPSYPGYFYTTAGQGTTNFLNGDSILRVKPNTSYKVSVWVRANATGSKVSLEPMTGSSVAAERTTPVYPISGEDVPVTWKYLSEEFTTGSAPSEKLYFRWFVNHSSGTNQNTIFYFTGFSVEEMVTGTVIKDGTISTRHVEANSISADKITIGLGTNLFPDPLIKDLTTWNAISTAYTTVVGGGKNSSGNALRVTASTGQTGNYWGASTGQTRRIPVVPGRSYRVTTWIKPSTTVTLGTNIAMYCRLYPESGIDSTGWTGPFYGNASYLTLGSNTIPTGVWTKFEIEVKVPDDATNTFMAPGFYLQAGYPTGSYVDWCDISVTEMSSGELIVSGAITADKIKSDAIDGMTITGALIQTDKLANKGIKLKNEGLEVYSPEGEKTLSITAGQGVDYIGIWGHEKAIVDEETGTLSFPVNPDTGSPYDPEQVATITAKGEISGKSLEVNDLSVAETLQFSGEPMDGHGSGNHGPTIMGRDLLGATYTDFFNDNYGESGSAWLTPLPHGLLSNSYHNGWDGVSGSSWSVEGNPGKVQVLTHVRDTVEIKNGRGYLITYTTPAFKSTDGKAGSPGAAVVKYTTGRTLGVDAGSTLHGSRYYISGSSDFDNPGRTIYAVGGQDLPVGDITLGVEVYVYDGRRIESTETADARYWSINILDVGSAFKGNTGNVRSISKKVPAAPTSPPVVDPPPAPKPPVKKTYTKTWNASWWATYWVGNGNGINSGLKSPKVAQGRPPGVGYNQRGAIGFPNMLGASDLNGVELGYLKKVEVYVYASHWYSSAGGTLEIGTHGHTSKPSTMSEDLVTNRKSQSLKKPEGRWVTLPSSVHAGLLSGSVRGIQAYTTSTSLSRYGYLDGKKSKIRVTYAK